MDHIAASLDQTSGSFNQPLESKWLGKHGNLPEGLWKSFPGVSGDEEEGHLAPRQSRRDLAYRPAVQVAVEQCGVQFGVSIICSASLAEPVDATTSAPAFSRPASMSRATLAHLRPPESAVPPVRLNLKWLCTRLCGTSGHAELMSYTAYGEAREWYVKTALLELSVEFRRRAEKLDRFYHAPESRSLEQGQAFEHDAPTQENSRPYRPTFSSA
jgi:hypothetical protein